MLSKKLAIEIMNICLSTGGDYAELYVEDTTANIISLENGKVESYSSSESFGIGIRILKGFESVYGYTSDLSPKSLKALSTSLSAAFTGERIITVESIEDIKVKNIHHIKHHMKDVPTEEIVEYLKRACEISKSVDPDKISRVCHSFSSKYRTFEVFSSEGRVGKHIKNTEERSRLYLSAIATDGVNMESGFKGPATCSGWEYFRDQIDINALASAVSKVAIKNLSAKECPSGNYTVVIKNGWGGVIFHEACGHSLEATATAKHLSVFSESIGKQIASPIVSAYDDGTIPNSWGSDSVDSEGVFTQKNQLIKDGICVGFLVDRLNGRRLGMEPNGTARRQSYKYEPTSRMSNTYIEKGKDDPEDIIKDTKLGIYVVDFGGGSVTPMTGEFNFSASEAYIIRDGKIEEPVKGCTLIGSAPEILMNIDRVGNDLELGPGMCGSASGQIPVTVGQPTIRVKTITVGGRGGKLE